MKTLNLKTLSLAALSLCITTVSHADFESITCANDAQGAEQLSLVKSHDGTGYDLKLTRSRTSTEEVYASDLNCRNLPNSGAGTFISLVHCVGNGSRVLVTHAANINWVDVGADGNLVQVATGTRVEFIISRPGQDFPYQILRFTPGQCKQL